MNYKSKIKPERITNPHQHSLIRGYHYHTSTIGLGCEGLVVGWTLGVGSVAANEGGYKEIPFNYQYAPAQTVDL